MTRPFLKQIASHYCACGTDMGRTVFVLPSRRAVVFFRKYFAEAVRENSEVPVMAPAMLSIEEFLCSLDSRGTADRLTLLLRLYDCYKTICLRENMVCETLDEFVFWGDVILADFDDVDKYRIDARDIFRNVSELKDLSDDFSYLSDSQKAALESFLHHFTKGDGWEKGGYKLKFARLWNILGSLYEEFNASLDAAGLCYAGKLYRDLATRFSEGDASALLQQALPGTEKLVFCGLNVLCECEKTILKALQSAGLAEFCWDYASDWIRDSRNKSSLMMDENVRLFPNAFELNPCEVKPSIEVVSVPSAVGQTRVVSELLRDANVPGDERTAIVLPDETLLQPLLNAIPPRIEEVNVTMGYSMTCSSFYSLFDDISLLQLRLRRKDDKWFFYHKPFWSIASNNVFNALLDDVGRDILSSIKKSHGYYIDSELVKGSPMLEMVFRPVVTDLKSNDASQIDAIASYQLDILQFVGSGIAVDDGLRKRFALELDFAMEYVKAVNLLSSHNMSILPQTWFKLLDNAMSSKAVPIKGEPLTGLQIMGPLETRALDFDRIFILSCNEGVFPRSSSSSSFIPPLLRHGFGLPTFEYQDAVWAYYFYRMIQRPSSVCLLMDSRTEGMKSGEESRYIKQLRYHFSADVRTRTAMASPVVVDSEESVPKTDEDIAFIRSKELSATALQNYLSCPMKFYYSFVKGLKADEEVSESMDAGIIGNVYHKVMQTIYSASKDGRITAEYLRSLKDASGKIAALVEDRIRKEMNCDEITGRDIVFCTIICKYVKKTLEHDLAFLKEKGLEAFNVVSLERTYRTDFHGFRFKGALDRLDVFTPGALRVVDYKTGKVLDEDVNIDDSNAAKIADKIFDPEASSSKWPKIALQFYIYDMIMKGNPDVLAGRELLNCVYSTRSLLKERPVESVCNETFCREMETKLADCLDSIVDKDRPFTRRKQKFNDRTCEFCDFKTICGR